MNHCVASYIRDINQDKCAIYSFVYEPEGRRYTIEFSFKDGKYSIRQIQSRSNHGCSKEARDYVMQKLKSSLLEVGKEYNVVGVEVLPWHTLVYLKEFPGKTFNSVVFEEIGKE